MATEHTTDSAAALIEKSDQRWFDFCAERGHIPGNVGHMTVIHKDFRDYLNEEC